MNMKLVLKDRTELQYLCKELNLTTNELNDIFETVIIHEEIHETVVRLYNEYLESVFG